LLKCPEKLWAPEQYDELNAALELVEEWALLPVLVAVACITWVPAAHLPRLRSWM